MRIRLASVLAVTVIALFGVSACGNASDCSLNACTVTFDGVDAEVSVLGVAARVVKVEGDQVTLEVAGAQQVVTVGQPSVAVGPFQAQVRSANKDAIVVILSR